MIILYENYTAVAQGLVTVTTCISQLTSYYLTQMYVVKSDQI